MLNDTVISLAVLFGGVWVLYGLDWWFYGRKKKK